MPARIATIVDVARLADVSIGSVSRVINGNATVLPKTRERVQKAMAELNYQPNAVAQSMRQGATNAVGCLVSDISHPVAAEMLGGAERRLREAGYAMLVASSHYDLAQETSIIQFFRQRKLDGMILLITDDEDHARVQMLRKLGIPIVLWERDAGGSFDASLTDHYAGTLQATKYLLDLGHRDIAMVAGHERTLVGREQVRGYEAAFRACGLEIKPSLIYRTGKFDYQACATLLSDQSRPTAMIANINEMTQVLKVAKSMSFSVPADLSLISIGDGDLLSIINPSITAVRGDGAAVGRNAASMLIERIANDNRRECRRLVFSAELIVRESCAAPKVK